MDGIYTTPEDLKEVPNGKVLRVVIMTSAAWGRKRNYLFVAIKGHIEDWTIYGLPTEPPYLYPDVALDEMVDNVLNNGEKLTIEEYIQQVVPCIPEMMALYRQ